MIAGIFHAGSGCGNQLHRYVATRVLALDKGYDFSMVAPELFKGSSFMNLDMGIETGMQYVTVPESGKVIPMPFPLNPMNLWEEKTPYYNPEFNFIEDNTIIDGEFQAEQYFEHRLKEINEWLKVEPTDVPNEVLAVGFRGGEFYTVPELGLPSEYWGRGIEEMNRFYKGIKRCEVHTDDPALAKKFFGGPTFPSTIIHDISINWRSMRHAKYALIANSSFYILPRLLKHAEDPTAVTIAPRYWDRYNIKKWERPYNYYKAFSYI